MSYRAPLSDMILAMRVAGGLDDLLGQGLRPDLDRGTLDGVLQAADRFAQDVLAPLNRPGDLAAASLGAHGVVAAPGWREAYAAWIEGGWAGLTAPEEAGGMALPGILDAACLDMWSGANMAFMLCPMLSAGAVGALARHGSPELRALYLPKLSSGVWSATMDLTEPQAGSDLSALRTRAERAGDGTYRLFGQKIYITYGEHDLTENIVHLVLARLPDAPSGTRGISMFLAPRFLPDESGGPVGANDMRCVGLERKLGIHASPTCTMVYGEREGARAWLVGEENRGLACMFSMMNSARLGVGLQGVGVAEAATQKALAFARERRQGRPPGWVGQGQGQGEGSSNAMAPIIGHADVRRMLMTMAALTAAARAICYATAGAADRARFAPDAQERASAQARVGLLTPVAKAFGSDVAFEVASLGVQVHGGMGYIEETGAAQFLRDARISSIYEGTNGIQAIDLVTRKLGAEGGAPLAAEIADMRAALVRTAACPDPWIADCARPLGACVDALERACAGLLTRLADDPDAALAGATPLLRLFALARGGTHLADMALWEAQQEAQAARGPTRHGALARFLAFNMCVLGEGLAAAALEGGDPIRAAELALG